ncbi:MAG: hypothetical protein M3P85_13830 [Actinomycetota bacterium]|nr:hypothetical protein [Actinomycetota bacterium]
MTTSSSTWEQPHPSLFNERSQKALASLLSLSPGGWYIRLSLARAMAEAVGINEQWGNSLLVQAGKAGAVPNRTLEFRAITPGRRGPGSPVKRSFVLIQPERIKAIWHDFDWSAVPALQLDIEPDLPDLPAPSFVNSGAI